MKNNIVGSGIKLLSAKKFKDNRGFFTEVFNPTSDLLPRPFKTASYQVNSSFSKKGTIRGMHFQYSPRMEKIITVLHGTIKFVELDIRPKSETYGKTFEIILTGDSQYSLYVPFGFANGFEALEDSIIVYACTGFYNPKTDVSVNPLSKEVIQHWDALKTRKIFSWSSNTAIISDKDTSAPHFSELGGLFKERIT